MIRRFTHALIVLISLCATNAVFAGEWPNVLLICMDDLRPELKWRIQVASAQDEQRGG